MALGTKETYPFRDLRRPPVPRNPCGCLVSTTLHQKRNNQQYALRLHPATCTMEVQNFTCRVRSSFECLRIRLADPLRPHALVLPLCPTRQSQQNCLTSTSITMSARLVTGITLKILSVRCIMSNRDIHRHNNEDDGRSLFA